MIFSDMFRHTDTKFATVHPHIVLFAYICTRVMSGFRKISIETFFLSALHIV